MLGLNPSMRFYLCEGPVDMRKGIFTLAELVRKIMGKEPSTGDIFIFLSMTAEIFVERSKTSVAA